MFDLSEARQRHDEVLREAERAAFRRKLARAHKWEQRASRAAHRARQASQAIG